MSGIVTDCCEVEPCTWQAYFVDVVELHENAGSAADAAVEGHETNRSGGEDGRRAPRRGCGLLIG